MNLSAIDLNLLTAFEALFSERNVTRAGTRLGLTQPAMSNALRRLRELLGDPLFVRATREMIPTPRAAEISPRISDALNTVREILAISPFEPQSSNLRFSVATTDYIEFLYLPSVWRRIQDEAPRMALAVRRIPTMFMPPGEELESGVFDFAIGPFPLPLTPQSGLHSLRIFRDRWTCLVRKGHPTVKRRLSLKEFASLKHIPISYPSSEGPGMVDRLLASKGLKRTAATTVAHFIAAPFYVANSDCITVVPMRMARFFTKLLPVRILPLPLPQSPLDISLLWHDRIHSEPAYVWLRKLISSATAPRRTMKAGSLRRRGSSIRSAGTKRIFTAAASL